MTVNDSVMSRQRFEFIRRRYEVDTGQLGDFFGHLDGEIAMGVEASADGGAALSQFLEIS